MLFVLTGTKSIRDCTEHCTIIYNLFTVGNTTSGYCTEYFLQCIVYCEHSRVYIVKCSVHCVQYTAVYSVLQYTVYSVQWTMYSVQCTVYSVQCSVLSVQYRPLYWHMSELLVHCILNCVCLSINLQYLDTNIPSIHQSIYPYLYIQISMYICLNLFIYI